MAPVSLVVGLASLALGVLGTLLTVLLVMPRMFVTKEACKKADCDTADFVTRDQCLAVQERERIYTRQADRRLEGIERLCKTMVRQMTKLVLYSSLTQEQKDRILGTEDKD